MNSKAPAQPDFAAPATGRSAQDRLSPTERTRIRRHSERAKGERADLYAVLDAAMICHLGVVMDGAPVVLPTAFGRVEDTLYVHGSSGNRSLRAADGQQVCITVTHLDGVVCARSVFSHSVNYRSAMVFGTAHLVTDPDERLAALRAITEQVVPGRWEAVRAPSRKELAQTIELAVPLGESSVKMRSGPPADEQGDMNSPVWAGVVPLAATFGTPQPDPALLADVAIPGHIRALANRKAGPSTA